MPAPHSPEFRRRALDLVARGNSVAPTARDLGISESCLRNWMNRDAIDSGRKAGVTTDEHWKSVDPRRRNRVLEMEIEILKPASAFFARENVLPKWGSGWFRSSPLSGSPVAVARRFLKVSTCDYDDWTCRRPSPPATTLAELTTTIRRIHADSRRAGCSGRWAGSHKRVDNALSESFWPTMRRELLDRTTWVARTQPASAMLEGVYNLRRRHTSLDNLSPVEFEALHTTAPIAA